MSRIGRNIHALLIETNIRQRGIGNPNPVKLGRCIKELERIYGIEHGGDRKSSTNNSVLKSQLELASQMGISVDTLQNYKMLADMVPELEELVDTGIVTGTTAIAIIKNFKFRALISNNFGRRKNDPVKNRKAIATYVFLRGYSNGGDRQAQCQNGTLLSLDEIAKELNMSKRNLQRALRIERNLTDLTKQNNKQTVHIYLQNRTHNIK